MKKNHGDDRSQILEINPRRLDEEWIDQAGLVEEFSMQLADAEYKKDKAEAKLELIQAELDIAIRKDPEHFDIPKATEGAIKTVLTVNPKYQAAVNDVIDARNRVNRMKAFNKALDVKKTAMENIVVLQGRMEYADVPSRHVREAVEDMEKKRARRPIKKRGSDDE